MHAWTMIAMVAMAACGGSTPESVTTPAPIAGDAPATAAAGERYDVALHRPSAVGDRYLLTERGVETRVQVIEAGGQVVQNERTQREIFLEAEVRVVAINSVGKPTQREYTVRRCTASVDGAPEREILPPGAVVVLTAVAPGEGEGSIALRGGQLSEEQEDLLDVILSTRASTVTDQDVFGSDTARGVGESWPIDNELAARDLNKDPNLQVDPARLSGQTTLVGVAEGEDGPMMEIRSVLEADAMVFGGLPPGATIDDARLVATVEGTMPVDVQRRRGRTRKTMQMDLQVSFVAEGTPATMRMRFTQQSESTTSEL